MRAQSPTWEDSLEKSMETHSGILFFFVKKNWKFIGIFFFLNRSKGKEGKN